ncbi:MAG: hypothetical protein IJW49_09675 [Clostridia bacterium]|nr:hypothetical protein [Clostridia bacterium]
MGISQELKEIMQQNDAVTLAYSRYLNYLPRVVTPDMVNDLVRECHVDTHEAYLSLFSAVLGWEPDENPEHRALEHRYLRQGLRCLNPLDYKNDPYCKIIRFPNQKNGTWEFKESFYAPFEPFVCNHPVCTDKFREIPQIGYFTEEFRFPAVLENGIEWMTVTPNEIETMREPIANAHGRVLTLGLGLGYFAFSASQKEAVESVTVVERDRRVIDLFNNHLLPQFPHREKIFVVEGDAFDYFEKLSPNDFDSIFADLWHDQGDGLEMYLKLCRIERQNGLKNVDYWIEPTLLSTLRHLVYDRVLQQPDNARLQSMRIEEMLSDKFLKNLAPDIRKA